MYGQHAYLDIRAGIPEAGTDKPLIPDLARPCNQPSIAESKKKRGGLTDCPELSYQKLIHKCNLIGNVPGRYWHLGHYKLNIL